MLFAQNYDDPGLGEKPVSAHPQDYKPLGIRAGSFMLHPGVHLAAEFTDNVFYTKNLKQSDTIFHIRPYISAQSTWSSHSLNVKLAADIARYADYDFRNYEDYFLIANGQISGPKTHDAKIAALCLGHGVTELWTADRDFSRFPELSCRNPLV